MIYYHKSALFVSLFALIAACSATGTESCPSSGVGGGGQGAATSSASSSASSSPSVGAGGTQPPGCLPCNARLDDREIAEEEMCSASRSLWQKFATCACGTYSDAGATKILVPECWLPKYMPPSTSHCSFDESPAYSSCDWQARWQCEAEYSACAHDWTSLAQ